MRYVFLTIGVLLPVFGVWAQDYPPSEGLVLWLDAGDLSSLTLEDKEVVLWRNKAPGAADALLSETGRRPQYDSGAASGIRPVVRFNGRSTVLRGLHFGKSADRWTLVLVAAPYRGGGGLCSARSMDGHDYDPGFTVDLFNSTTQFDAISVEGAGRIGGQKDQLTRAIPFGGLHVLVVERDEKEIRLFVDGVREDVRSVQPALTRMEEIRVGARYFENAERCFFEGEIAGVLLYTRILKPEERSCIEKALAASSEEQAAGQQRRERLDAERQANRMIAPKLVQTWPSISDFEEWERLQTAAESFRPVSTLPIRTDLQAAMVLGVHHLSSLFDADRDNEPFFYSNRRVDGLGEMHHSVAIGIPHVVGRCLLGGIAAERMAGVPFPDPALLILERYLKSSFDNPDHLNSYFDPDRGNQRFIEFHNMREGLFGLWALVAGRQSDWARQQAGLMLNTLAEITDENGHWSMERIKEKGMTDRCMGVSIPNATRMVDALLAFHRATGDPLALQLAGKYARAGLREMFESDGRFADMARSSGHVHSITSSLSGITDYAIFVKDDEMLASSRRIMDTGVPGYHSSWGWGDEVFPGHPANELSRGEINQTGDVIRTALLLGEAGFPEYYETAERFLRSMLLPTQHQEAELRLLVKDNPQPSRDADRDVLLRTVGGFAMQRPNDRMREGDWPLSTLDITSGAVHALAESWRHRVTVKEATCFVNLLFDAEYPEVRIHSGLPVAGRIEFVMKSENALAIRIPTWVEAKALIATVNGNPAAIQIENGYIRLGALHPGDNGVVSFPIPCKQERETVDEIEYTTLWAGNQLLEILPRGTVSPLPF